MKIDRNFSTPLIFILAVLSFFIYYFTPFEGDDLSYRGVFSGACAMRSIVEFPLWCGSHWLGTNGRLPNLMVALLANGPKWILALVASAVFFFMFYMVVKAAGVRRGLLPVGLVFTVAVVYPWWDSQYLFVCVANYVGAIGFGLLAYMFIKDSGKRTTGRLAWEAVLCLIAGACHEGMAIPMVCGFGFYFLFSGWRPGRQQWVLLVAFGLGLLYTLSSPALWSRILESGTADDTPLMLLLKSDGAVVALWVLIAVMACFRKGRSAVGDLFRSPLVVLAVAGVFNAVICMNSGVVGRSGAFGQVFSIVVAFGWLNFYRRPESRVAEAVLSALLIAQFAGLAVIQHRLWGESEEMLEKYKASADGAVFMDATRDNELPWWTLNHLRGVPDADDSWLLYHLAKYYSADRKRPVIMPTEAEGLIPLRVDSTRLSNGDLLVKRLPEGRVDTIPQLKDNKVVVLRLAGEPWVVQDVAGGYYLTPRILDPGDR